MRGAPSRSWIGLAGSAGLGFALLVGAPLAGAYVGVGIQPAIEADYTTITLFGGPGGSDTLVFGNEQLQFSNGFTAPPPPSGVNDCSGSVAALAGVGMPAAPTLVNDAYATVHCPAGSDVGPGIYSSGEADSLVLYKIKGPAATYSSTAVRLGGTLHGSLSGSLDFGQPANNASSAMQVYYSAEAGPRLNGISLISGSLLAKPVYGSPPVFLLADSDLTLANVDDQSTASTAIFAIDRAFESDLEVFGWVATLRTSLLCSAETSGPPALAMVAQTGTCDFDRGEAYLESTAPSVILERIAPLKPTTPRSAAYLSPASGPIQTFPGSPGVPSSASGAGDLGQGATGDAQASIDLPLVNTETTIRTRAAAHVDQAATTANSNATVVSEGQSAASLVYHVTPGPGFNGWVNASIVYTTDFTLSVTKGLDPSIVESSSFAVTSDLEGAPFYHFKTLSIGNGNEDPPGLSGNILFPCTDQSTATTQACQITNFPDDTINGVYPDAKGNLVLTVQSDCTARLVHPSGPVAAAHPACDASHTLTAKLISNSASATLTLVPEPEASELGIVCAGVLALGRRITARRAR